MEEADAELIARTRAGDHDAFRALVDRYKNPLVGYLSHMVRDRSHAEELAQEAFVRVYQNVERYRDDGKFAPYLFRIATNLYRSECRRKRRWDFLLLGFSRNGTHQRSPQTEALEQEIVRHVSGALAALPLRYRSAVVLRDIEGWSYDDIARMLGCNTGTIKSRISRGREQLKHALTPYWNGGTDARR